MTRRLWWAVAIVAVAIVAYPLVTLASGSPRFPTRDECVRPAVEGQPVDIVFGRVDSPVEAAELRDRVIAVGFVGTESLGDGCGRWEVVLEGVPSIDVGRQVQEEAASVELDTTLELGSGT